ncbi:TlpA family protein disulfide reductase [Pontimicrobium aquaticum]|uniref:Redoxin domain-containing protein n=1 Tax=Pontimicrobium aquaticum TaxID=2565367 RepID=A0A4U0F2S3_9FLAO|nr:redoxin family protein [Pontimicrobium aquaticum]TJY38074.1 redoxin domain-containing protein [Pontimicrobium aquaticum]
MKKALLIFAILIPLLTYSQSSTYKTSEDSINNILDKKYTFFMLDFVRLTEDKKNDSLTLLRKNFAKDILELNLKNPDSEVAIEALYKLRLDIDKKAIAKVLNNVSAKLKNNPYVQVLNVYSHSKTLNVGDLYTDVSAKSLDGKEIKISNVLNQNKPVLVILGGFFCMREHGREILKNFHKEYGDKINILNYFFTDSKEEWIKESKYNLDIPLLSDLKGDFSPIKVIYDVQITPTVYLLDKKGKIILKQTGYGEDVNRTAKSLID